MAKRRSIHIAGFKHANPIPAASRIGPLLVSSVVVGRDPATGELPEAIEEQCIHLFAHVRAMLAEAGATPEDVVKMEFWMHDAGTRAIVNQEWLKMFPDFDCRPSRHTHTTGGGQNLQATFTAYIERD